MLCVFVLWPFLNVHCFFFFFSTGWKSICGRWNLICKTESWLFKTYVWFREVIYLSGLSWNCLYHYCFLRTLLKPYISDCSSISLEKGLGGSDSEVLYFLLHHWAQHWLRNERWSWLRELCKCDVWFFFFFLGCFWWINYSCLAAVVH